jgi:hypothetical protein
LEKVMASNARIFLAGVGTTFIILGAGFGGGLLMAKSAFEEPTGYRSRGPSKPLPPARVVLPSTTEAALPPQTPKEQVVGAPPEPAPQPHAPIVQATIEKQAEKVDTRKAGAEERRWQRRFAERKVKRRTTERAKHPEQVEPDQHSQRPIMAFSGDEPRLGGGFGFFGRD